MWVLSLASLSALRIWHGRELWGRSQTPSLGTSVCCEYSPIKTKKTKKKKKKKKKRKRKRNANPTQKLYVLSFKLAKI